MRRRVVAAAVAGALVGAGVWGEWPGRRPVPAAAHHGNSPQCDDTSRPAPNLTRAFPVLWRSTVSAGSASAKSETFVSEFHPNAGHEGEDVFPIPLGASNPAGSRWVVAPDSGRARGPFDQRANGGPGWVVKIEAADYLYKIFHLYDSPTNYGIRENRSYNRGTKLGKVGNSGNASGTSPHAHVEMWEMDAQRNPVRAVCPFLTLWNSYARVGQVSLHGTPITRFTDAYARVGGAFPSATLGVPTGRCYGNNGGCGTPYIQDRGTFVLAQDLDGGSLLNPVIVDANECCRAGVVWGSIGARFIADGGQRTYGSARDNGGGLDEHNWCGYTAASPTKTVVNDFTGTSGRAPAAIVYTPTWGARHIWGGAFNRYVASGGPCGLGPPITDMAQGIFGLWGFYSKRADTGVCYWTWVNTTNGATGTGTATCP